MMGEQVREVRLIKATWPAHALAVSLSMSYAWGISQTVYVQTSIQFISPLLVVLLVHLLWVLMTTHREPGYARTVVYRAFLSSVVLALLVPAIMSVAPMPSTASSGAGAFNGVWVVLFCLAVLAIVLFIIAFIVYLGARLLELVAKAIMKQLGDRNNLNDLSILATLFVFVALASLEGISGFYRFAGTGQATASVAIDAPPEKVWTAMQTATAAEFPLPGILQAFPQPVAVRVDEGTGLGAKRVVVFAGREGRGELHLEVVEREGLRSVFETVSDSTPIANWIAINSITYEVIPRSQAAVLNVTLGLRAPARPITDLYADDGHRCEAVHGRVGGRHKAKSRTRPVTLSGSRSSPLISLLHKEGDGRTQGIGSDPFSTSLQNLRAQLYLGF